MTGSTTPPLRFTFAPLPPAAGVIVPLIVRLVGTAVAVKLTPVALAPLIVTNRLGGEKLYPDLLGVTCRCRSASR